MALRRPSLNPFYHPRDIYSSDLRELVRHIATGTDFGYTRIPGELRKLGIRRICRQTVKNILKEQGTDPRPKRGKGTWDQFVRIHAKTLWGPWCIPSKNCSSPTRSHSRRDHLTPLRQDLPEEQNTIKISEIVCRERLGGLIKSFERAAA